MRGYSQSSLVLGLSLSFLALGVGCSTYKVRPMPQMKAQEAPARMSIDGVDFGARALHEGSEIKATFNFNLLSNGFLPIHLVVDNRSESEIEFLRARIECQTPGGERMSPIAATAASTGEGRNAMVEAIFFFGIFSYDNANKYNRDLERDWAEKGMGEVQVLRSGRTMSKFLYFEVGKDFNPSGTSLRVPFDRVGSSRQQVAVLSFD